MDEIARARRQRLTVHRFTSLADADRASCDDGRRLGPTERVLEVWRLSVEQWQLRRGGNDEPGLCRSVRASAAADVQFMVVGAYALADVDALS